MLTQFSRTELLLGKEAMNRLEGARVAVFGIGGVGGYVCEALARSGVGKLDLIDNDKVCMSNLNRQIIATRKTVGQYKTEDSSRPPPSSSSSKYPQTKAASEPIRTNSETESTASSKYAKRYVPACRAFITNFTSLI